MKFERLIGSRSVTEEYIAPSFWRDVLLVTGLATGGAWLALRRVNGDVAWLVGVLMLIWRLREYYNSRLVRYVERGGEPGPEQLPSSPVVIPHIRVDRNSVALARYGSFDKFTARNWETLARALLGGERITREVLSATGLWKNITGVGRSGQYVYQEIMGDLEHLHLMDGGKLTETGRTWFARFATPPSQNGRFASPAVSRHTTESTDSDDEEGE